MMKSSALFTRLVETHRPDCLLSLPGPGPEAVPDPEVLARTFGSDSTRAYAQSCRPIYESLRRMIGQLSGLLILAELTGRAEINDLKELASCRARWDEAADRLAALSPPLGLQAHFIQLKSALLFLQPILRTFPELSPSGGNEALFEDMSVRIKRSYAHLEAASSRQAGLQMVDFTNACCCCTR